MTFGSLNQTKALVLSFKKSMNSKMVTLFSSQMVTLSKILDASKFKMFGSASQNNNTSKIETQFATSTIGTEEEKPLSRCSLQSHSTYRLPDSLNTARLKLFNSLSLHDMYIRHIQAFSQCV